MLTGFVFRIGSGGGGKLFITFKHLDHLLTTARTLGFNATLSPFTIALAFHSPLLNTVNSAAGAEGVVEILGEVRLKFGAVDADNVNNTQGDPRGEEAYSTGRLGLGLSESVLQPRKGSKFRK